VTGRWLWTVPLAAVVIGGCARPMAPGGGEVPDTPVRVVGTEPAPLSVVEPFDGPVVFTFERRVSERPTDGSLRDAVVVSPRTGEVQVRMRSQGLEVSIEGGFVEPTVYRITLLPRFRDLYQNRMAEPFDLIFSTGGELEPNLMAGVVADRLTLAELAGVRVDAVPFEEGAPHSTVTDSTGIFTFPHLPSGRYRVVAYEDLNRNRSPDFEERQDSMELAINRGDTLIVTELAILAPDTTAANLEAAVLLDSLTLRVTFDDPLDPEEPLDEVAARLFREDANAPEVLEILHLHEWEERQTSPDPDAPPPDPADPAPLPPAPAPIGPLLPERDLVLVLSRPLLPGVIYRVEVEGVRNLNGVPDGGGAVEIEGPPEPPPVPAPAEPIDAADPPTPDTLPDPPADVSPDGSTERPGAPSGPG